MQKKNNKIETDGIYVKFLSTGFFTEGPFPDLNAFKSCKNRQAIITLIYDHFQAQVKP